MGTEAKISEVLSKTYEAGQKNLNAKIKPNGYEGSEGINPKINVKKLQKAVEVKEKDWKAEAKKIGTLLNTFGNDQQKITLGLNWDEQGAILQAYQDAMEQVAEEYKNEGIDVHWGDIQKWVEDARNDKLEDDVIKKQEIPEPASAPAPISAAAPAAAAAVPAAAPEAPAPAPAPYIADAPEDADSGTPAEEPPSPEVPDPAVVAPGTPAPAADKIPIIAANPSDAEPGQTGTRLDNVQVLDFGPEISQGSATFLEESRWRNRDKFTAPEVYVVKDGEKEKPDSVFKQKGGTGEDSSEYVRDTSTREWERILGSLDGYEDLKNILTPYPLFVRQSEIPTVLRRTLKDSSGRDRRKFKVDHLIEALGKLYDTEHFGLDKDLLGEFRKSVEKRYENDESHTVFPSDYNPLSSVDKMREYVKWLADRAEEATDAEKAKINGEISQIKNIYGACLTATEAISALSGTIENPESVEQLAAQATFDENDIAPVMLALKTTTATDVEPVGPALPTASTELVKFNENAALLETQGFKLDLKKNQIEVTIIDDTYTYPKLHIEGVEGGKLRISWQKIGQIEFCAPQEFPTDALDATAKLKAIKEELLEDIKLHQYLDIKLRPWDFTIEDFNKTIQIKNPAIRNFSRDQWAQKFYEINPHHVIESAFRHTNFPGLENDQAVAGILQQMVTRSFLGIKWAKGSVNFSDVLEAMENSGWFKQMFNTPASQFSDEFQKLKKELTDDFATGKLNEESGQAILEKNAEKIRQYDKMIALYREAMLILKTISEADHSTLETNPTAEAQSSTITNAENKLKEDIAKTIDQSVQHVTWAGKLWHGVENLDQHTIAIERNTEFATHQLKKDWWKKLFKSAEFGEWLYSVGALDASPEAVVNDIFQKPIVDIVTKEGEKKYLRLYKIEGTSVTLDEIAITQYLEYLIIRGAQKKIELKEVASGEISESTTNLNDTPYNSLTLTEKQVELLLTGYHAVKNADQAQQNIELEEEVMSDEVLDLVSSEPHIRDLQIQALKNGMINANELEELERQLLAYQPQMEKAIREEIAKKEEELKKIQQQAGSSEVDSRSIGTVAMHSTGEGEGNFLNKPHLESIGFAANIANFKIGQKNVYISAGLGVDTKGHLNAGSLIMTLEAFDTEKHNLSFSAGGGVLPTLENGNYSPSATLAATYYFKWGRWDVGGTAGLVGQAREDGVGGGLAVGLFGVLNEGRSIQEVNAKIRANWETLDEQVKNANTTKEKANLIRNFIRENGKLVIIGDYRELVLEGVDKADRISDADILEIYDSWKKRDHAKAQAEGKVPKIWVLGGGLGIGVTDKGIGPIVGVVLKIGDKTVVKFRADLYKAEAVSQEEIRRLLANESLKITYINSDDVIMGHDGRPALLTSQETINTAELAKKKPVEEMNEAEISSENAQMFSEIVYVKPDTHEIVPNPADTTGLVPMLAVSVLNRQNSHTEIYVDKLSRDSKGKPIRVFTLPDGRILIPQNYPNLFISRETFKYQAEMYEPGKATFIDVIIISNRPDFDRNQIREESPYLGEMIQNSYLEIREGYNVHGASDELKKQLRMFNDEIPADELAAFSGYQFDILPPKIKERGAKARERGLKDIPQTKKEDFMAEKLRDGFTDTVKDIVNDSFLNNIKQGNPRIDDTVGIIGKVNEKLSAMGQAELGIKEANIVYAHIQNMYYVNLWKSKKPEDIEKIKQQFRRHNEVINKKTYTKKIEKILQSYNIDNAAEKAPKIADYLRERAEKEFLAKLDELVNNMPEVNPDTSLEKLINSSINIGLYLGIGTTIRKTGEGTLVTTTAIGESLIGESLLLPGQYADPEAEKSAEALSIIIFDLLSPAPDANNLKKTLEAPLSVKLFSFMEATVTAIGIKNYELLADIYENPNNTLDPQHKTALKEFTNFVTQVRDKIITKKITASPDKPVDPEIKFANGSKLKLVNSQVSEGSYWVCGNLSIALSLGQFVLTDTSGVTFVSNSENVGTATTRIKARKINIAVLLSTREEEEHEKKPPETPKKPPTIEKPKDPPSGHMGTEG